MAMHTTVSDYELPTATYHCNSIAVQSGSLTVPVMHYTSSNGSARHCASISRSVEDLTRLTCTYPLQGYMYLYITVK